MKNSQGCHVVDKVISKLLERDWVTVPENDCYSNAMACLYLGCLSIQFNMQGIAIYMYNLNVLWVWHGCLIVLYKLFNSVYFYC